MTKKKNGRLIALISVLLVLGGYVLFLLYYNYFYSRLSEVEKMGVSRYMEKKANEAIDSAREKYDVELDRTPESIEAVEKILKQLRARHVNKPVEDSTIY